MLDWTVEALPKYELLVRDPVLVSHKRIVSQVHTYNIVIGLLSKIVKIIVSTSPHYCFVQIEKVNEWHLQP